MVWLVWVYNRPNFQIDFFLQKESHFGKIVSGKVWVMIYFIWEGSSLWSTRSLVSAVKLKNGPMIALFKVKSWSIVFFVFENLVLPAEIRLFSKTNAKTRKTIKLKIGPIMLRNILGPVFNFRNLFFLYFFGGGSWNFYFYSVFSKIAKLKETQKQKDTICEHTCANCSCQNVRFVLHVSVLLFFDLPCIWEMFLIGSQKLWKQQKQKQQQQQKIRCKVKPNLRLWLKIKQDNKQENKNKRNFWNKKQTNQ